MTDWGGRGRALEYLFLRGFQLDATSPDVGWPVYVHGEPGDGILEQIDGFLYLPFAVFMVEA